MKFFSTILIATALLARAAVCFEPTEDKPFNFKIEYSIAEIQESITDVVPLTNGDKFSLQFYFENHEPQPVSIVGVGGSFNDARTGILTNNITTSSIGPVEIASGESANFTQVVAVDVFPGDYLVVPGIYAVYNSTMMLLGSRSQLVTVEDPSVSLFDPHLLFLELLLLATVGALAYGAYELFGKQYLRKNQPIKVATIKKLVPADQTIGSSASSSASGYDESWLPKQHLKTKKLKRT